MDKCETCPINKIISLLDKIVDHCNTCKKNEE